MLLSEMVRKIKLEQDLGTDTTLYTQYALADWTVKKLLV
jgi:hypothetical protein